MVLEPKEIPANAESVEVIMDEAKLGGEKPVVSVRTGKTDNQTFFLRVRQPKGRALLIAVHL